MKAQLLAKIYLREAVLGQWHFDKGRCKKAKCAWYNFLGFLERIFMSHCIGWWWVWKISKRGNGRDLGMGQESIVDFLEKISLVLHRLGTYFCQFSSNQLVFDNRCHWPSCISAFYFLFLMQVGYVSEIYLPCSKGLVILQALLMKFNSGKNG